MCSDTSVSPPCLQGRIQQDIAQTILRENTELFVVITNTYRSLKR